MHAVSVTVIGATRLVAITLSVSTEGRKLLASSYTLAVINQQSAALAAAASFNALRDAVLPPHGPGSPPGSHS